MYCLLTQTVDLSEEEQLKLAMEESLGGKKSVEVIEIEDDDPITGIFN
jgi:hypothetical protein